MVLGKKSKEALLDSIKSSGKKKANDRKRKKSRDKGK